MDSMEINKAVASVLVAGIAFMLSGVIAETLVRPQHLEKTVLKIEGAATPAAGTPKPAELPPIAPLMASADPAKGSADVHKLCSACHTFTKGGPNGVGPNLWDVMTRGHAELPNFNYSNALKSKKGKWSYEELNQWLHKPSSYAPGTRMGFAGIRSEKERADVIAFLRSISDNPPPLPNPAAAAPAAAAPAAAAPAAAAPAKPAAPAPAAAPAAGDANHASLEPVGPLMASADPAKGGADAKKLCAVCHTFTKGGSNGVGPNLWGVMNRGRAELANFNYSGALKAKPGKWTYAELNQWLHKPSAYAQGTRMAFAGIRKVQERADVIAFLRSLSDTPVPLPAPAKN